MNKQILDLFKHQFEINIYEGDDNFIIKGSLDCKGDKSYSVPIINDIPRFNLTGKKHPQQDTYTYWWNVSHKNFEYNDVENEVHFKSTIKISDDEYFEKKIIDFGCGNGRFSRIVSKKNPKLLVLLDLSEGIDKAYYDAKENSNNVIAIQGNILEIPIKNEYFDVLYSWGVLHHTGDTRKAFKIATKLVKVNGLLGIYVYESHPLYKYDNTFLRLISILRQTLIISPLRFISQFMSPQNVKRFFTPIFYLEKFIGFGIIGCHSKTRGFIKEEYMRVVIDRFKSRYASEHTLEEIIEWFFCEGFDNLIVGEGTKINLTGKKSTKNNSVKHVDFH